MHHKLPRTASADRPNSPHILRLNTGYPPASARRLNKQSVHQNTSHPGPNSTDCLKVYAQISQNARGFELAAGPHPWIHHPPPSPKSKHRRPFGSFPASTFKAAEIYPAPGRNLAPTAPRPDEPPLAHFSLAQQELRLFRGQSIPGQNFRPLALASF